MWLNLIFIGTFNLDIKRGDAYQLSFKIKSTQNSKYDEKHIMKLSGCPDQYSISPIVVAVKKDQSIKLALDSKIINKAIHKNKYQMHNIDTLIDFISQQISAPAPQDTTYFSTSDLKYAYNQLNLNSNTAIRCI